MRTGKRLEGENTLLANENAKEDSCDRNQDYMLKDTL